MSLSEKALLLPQFHHMKAYIYAKTETYMNYVIDSPAPPALVAGQVYLQAEDIPARFCIADPLPSYAKHRSLSVFEQLH